MSLAGDFIKKHGMDYRSIILEEQMPVFLEEMRRGLDGRESSLLMLPTYLQVQPDIARGRDIVCVDAGGTNLRIATARFEEDGRFVMSEIARHMMPGVERELGAREFFDILAEYIAPYCAVSSDVVLSFAYRARPTEEIDMEILVITKEVKVRGAAGKLLAKEITASLARKGVHGVNMIVINDTVASALSGRTGCGAENCGAFTGTILGTGSNSCYPESNANIGKLDGLDPDGVMVINTEAGGYNKMPRTDIDLAFDKTTFQPEIGVGEKMTSGAYLGALCEFTLRAAAEEKVFRTKGVEEIERLRSADVSEYLASGSGIVEEYMLNEEDEANARELLENIVLRAARVAALQMAAMVEKAHKTNNDICLSIEGTTYEKMHGLKEELQRELMAYLKGRSYNPTLVTIDHAVLKGCAIAGLSR